MFLVIHTQQSQMQVLCESSAESSLVSKITWVLSVFRRILLSKASGWVLHPARLCAVAKAKGKLIRLLGLLPLTVQFGPRVTHVNTNKLQFQLIFLVILKPLPNSV